MFLMSRRTSPPVLLAWVFVVIATLLFAGMGRAQSAEKVVVGLLNFTSSGPVFLALERGYFKDANIEVELAVFQDAPSVAAATASGKVTFGVSALTAATYNLGAAGQLVILAGQSQEKKGFSGNQILVTKAAYERGLDSIEKLMPEPFGLTRTGSPSHYMLGQLANAKGFAIGDLEIVALQTLPNLVAALKSDAVTWAIIAPPIATDLTGSGAVVSLGPYSDYGSYQFGGVVAATNLVTAQPDLVRRFLSAYLKGLEAYSSINLEPTSQAANEAAKSVGRYVYPDLDADVAAQKVLASALYVDPTGRVDIEDIKRQVEWYFTNAMIKAAPSMDSLLRLDFLP